MTQQNRTVLIKLIQQGQSVWWQSGDGVKSRMWMRAVFSVLNQRGKMFLSHRSDSVIPAHRPVWTSGCCSSLWTVLKSDPGLNKRLQRALCVCLTWFLNQDPNISESLRGIMPKVTFTPLSGKLHLWGEVLEDDTVIVWRIGVIGCISLTAA